ncbi:MAG: His/Gly/Thr/Pro-type tRNA ligase C-terminal domain-containing protein, partial [candidate division WWE3 bacterium]|nr:His/Gly/Thr/Pro-type tRNA ligase C-terminal domain-containing protein [candidate division WWE3 bacterium]
GRYDNLIGIFLDEKIPATGISFGLDRLMAVVPEKVYRDIPFRSRVLVTIFSPELLNQTIRLFDQIQGQGVEAELYLDPNAKLDKQLKYADRKEIPYALIVGPDEDRSNQVTLRNLKEKTQQTLPLETILKALAQ